MEAQTNAVCSYRSCPSRNRVQIRTIKLLTCARCKAAFYCSKECQKKDWGHGHKIYCVPPDVTRHEVPDLSLASVQETIDKASPGDIVMLKGGEYSEPDPGQFALRIDKPLKLWGQQKRASVVLHRCNLTICPSGMGSDAEKAVILADFYLQGTCNIQNNIYKGITLYNVHVSMPHHLNDDALIIHECKNKCLIQGCEIRGGSDGVCIATEKVHLTNTKIINAQSRGIFSRRRFTIENCEVSGCGGYGIKGTAGWTKKGRNNIQPGPWSEFGGASSGNGGMGMEMW
mmetsp:Transcript_33296/g.80521  ORF Transcript_33296/g.80521 Transcript_33296/m.80521 type:complete len:286 (-) Transcript_33296:177-1034(-)